MIWKKTISITQLCSLFNKLLSYSKWETVIQIVNEKKSWSCIPEQGFWQRFERGQWKSIAHKEWKRFLGLEMFTPNDRPVFCWQFFYFYLYLLLTRPDWFWILIVACFLGCFFNLYICILLHYFLLSHFFIIGLLYFFNLYIYTFTFFFLNTWVASHPTLIFSPLLDIIYFICLLNEMWRCVWSNLQ